MSSSSSSGEVAATGLLMAACSNLLKHRSTGFWCPAHLGAQLVLMLQPALGCVALASALLLFCSRQDLHFCVHI
jgi:hypothetical protein